MNKKFLWILIILVTIIVVLVGLKAAGMLGKEEGIKVSVER